MASEHRQRQIERLPDEGRWSRIQRRVGPNMPRVMLLIPSASYRAPDFMQAASELGVEVVVGSDRSSPLEGLHPDRQVGLDFADPDRGARQIEEYARRYPLDTIVAVDDGGTRLAARASRCLGLPH